MLTKLSGQSTALLKLTTTIGANNQQNLVMVLLTGRQCQKRSFLMPPKSNSPNVNVLHDTFVPELVFKYNPLKYYVSKLKMWKLKYTWDRDFCEKQFVEHSKEMAATLTDIVRLGDSKKIAEFSTSNAYYQMVNESINFPNKSCVELLRFRKEDIRQAVPIKVQLHNILGLKYAVIDMAMVGLHNCADCDSTADLDKIKKALTDMEPDLKQKLMETDSKLPYVFIELFMRFRRNYSSANQFSQNIEKLQKEKDRWLVSVYKICRFNIFTMPPE